MIKKKLAIVGIVGVPANYGGFETLVEYLLDLLPEFYDITIYCQSQSYPEKIDTYKGAKLEYLNLKANGVQSVIYDSVSLWKSIRGFDYILILGVSGAVTIPMIRPFTKAKIVTHIDGLEWKREKWGAFAKKFLKFSEAVAVKFSDAIISDNKHIYDYVQNEYGEDSHLIAYGANHVVSVDPSLYEKKYSFIHKPYIFTVCRIEPENNIEMQLKAFSENDFSMPYVIVGNWIASDYGMKLYEKYSTKKNVILYNPIYTSEELNVLRSNCHYYLHGHSAGGTNPSLVEAMYLGLPIIAYGVNYNRETTFNRALYFNNSNELIELLAKLDNFDRESLSKDMQKLARKNYSWKAINKKYVKMLKSL
jgi:glycosyltransferase involved in cell wall biosynthesis